MKLGWVAFTIPFKFVYSPQWQLNLIGLSLTALALALNRRASRGQAQHPERA